MALQRIKCASCCGWQARVGKTTRFFADRKNGGSGESYRLAMVAQAELLRSHVPAERRLQANNSSGISGVRPRYVGRSLVIQASWSNGGRKGCTNFSVGQHGMLGAVELAIQAREAGSGIAVGLTPRQAWARMRKELGHGGRG